MLFDGKKSKKKRQKQGVTYKAPIRPYRRKYRRSTASTKAGTRVTTCYSIRE